MNTHPVITFPPRPPTTNALSFAERAALKRSSNKLEQILGSTPHVLDFTYTHIAGKTSDSVKVHGAGHRRAKSEQSSLSCTSSEKLLPKLPTPPADERAWRLPYTSSPSQRPPLLKLCTSTRVARRASSGRSQRPSTPVSPAAPGFIIVSEAMMRREKMRRLVRRLGEGVPVELVFPDLGAENTLEGDECEGEEEGDDETVVASTPTSCESKRISLASIPGAQESVVEEQAVATEEVREGLVRPEKVRLHTRHEPQWQTPRVSRFAKMLAGGRDAIYVVDEEDESALEDEVPTTGMCIC